MLDAAGNKNRAAGTANEWVTPVSLGIQIVSSGDLHKIWGHIRRGRPGLTMVGVTIPAVMPTVEESGAVEVNYDPMTESMNAGQE